jgi:lipopolysaccharide transport system permease protein
VFTVVLVLFLAAIGQAPSLAAIGLFACYCLSMTLIVVGFSLAASVLFLKYRDLNQVWDLVTQAGFFLAPIIYPLGIVPEKFHFYFYIWPPTPIIEFSRRALVSGQAPSVLAHAYLLAEVAVALIVGATVLKRMGPRAAELV